MSNIVDHSIFSDYTCSIGHSKIYSNYLFIFVKKEKIKRSPHTSFANCNALNFYSITFALFFLIHCHTFFPLYQYSYTKRKKKKNQIEVYMTSQSINSETKTIPKLKTYKTKQIIKQITSKLLYIYIYI